MHHREFGFENMNAGELAAVQDRRPPLRFQKRQPQKHNDARAQLERVGNKLIRKLERRVGDNARDPVRRSPLEQEVDPRPGFRTTAIDQVGGRNLMTGLAQNLDDGAGTAARFPNTTRQGFDAKQRLDGNGRRFVEIVAARSQRVAAGVSAWLTALLARRPTKIAAIALANKIARMAWAMMVKGERYKEPVALAA